MSKYWDDIEDERLRRRLQRWFPHQHYIASGWDGVDLKEYRVVHAACGIKLHAYWVNGTASLGTGEEITCGNCKRTHKYRNDLLQTELMS